MQRDSIRGADSASFLLAQIGAYAASRFAERLEKLEFAPHHAGILRVLSKRAGISQQDLARTLNMHASRLVAILDELQQRELIERRPSRKDRRLRELHLSSKGNAALRRIGQEAQEHHHALMKGLSAEQQQRLTELLEVISAQQGLSAGVHPGYRKL